MFRTLLLIISVIILVSTPVVGVGAQATQSNDDYESNDDIGSAADISPGAYSDLQLVSDETDYYAISVEDGDTLDISATFPYQSDGDVADNDPEMTLVDADGDGLDYNTEDSDPADDYATQRIRYEADASRTVYIEVEGTDGDDVSTAYDLTVDRNENDPNEPNGGIGTATAIEPGSHDATLLDDEHDYYSLSVEDGDTLNISATYPYQSDGDVADNDPEMTLVDSDGDSLDYNTEDSDPADDYATQRIRYEADASRTVYIEFEGTDEDDTLTSYSFTVEQNANDPNEPNGGVGSATAIEPGSHEATLLDDEHDYYSLSVESGETLNISATYPYQSDGDVADNDPEMTLVDGDGDSLDYNTEDSDPADDYATQRIRYESDSSRTVYIEFEGTDEDDTLTSYDFTVERNANDPNEPNGGVGSATAIEPGSHDATLLDDEHDYYSLSVESGETLNISATYPYQSDGDVADNDPEMTLVDGDGDSLDYNSEDSDPADDYATQRIRYEADASQTVYLEFEGTDEDDTLTSYNFTVERNANDPNEPNGGIGSATATSAGTYENLTLLDDERDYYSLSLQEGGSVSVTATFPYQSDGDLAANGPELALVDGDGDVLQYADDESDPADDYATETIDYESESAQTVYIRIAGTAEADVVSAYDLAIETTGVSSPETPTATPEPTAETPDSTAEDGDSEATDTDENVPTTSVESGEDRRVETTANEDDGSGEADDEPEDTASGSGPGFTAALAVVALLAGVALRRRATE